MVGVLGGEAPRSGDQMPGAIDAAEVQIWRKARARPWIPLLLGGILHAWAFYEVYRALTEGVVFHGPRGHRRWIRLADDPAAFWFEIGMDLLVLVLFWGVVLWVATGVRRHGAQPTARPRED